MLAGPAHTHCGLKEEVGGDDYCSSYRHAPTVSMHSIFWGLEREYAATLINNKFKTKKIKNFQRFKNIFYMKAFECLHFYKLSISVGTVITISMDDISVKLSSWEMSFIKMQTNKSSL